MRRLSRRHLLRAGLSGAVTAVGGCGSRDSASFLALGDSYTVGSGVSREDRWADRLPDRLRDQGYAIDAPTVVADGGWTTDRLREETREGDLWAEEDGTNRGSGYDLVSLCIGANDAFQGRPAAEFRPRFEAVLEDAVRYAGDRPANVLVLTIPDYTVTPVGRGRGPDAHRERLETYNGNVEHASATRGTRFVDLVEPSRRVVDEPGLVADDGLHPSAAQHGLWLDRIAPAAAEILAE